ncbi:NO-inducible flavohemoprotein [Kushneria phosphatilytica]|uniref:nitric oxide dioxygenase n=1 Tax=Kushneria phosphatilytica TaxID=657387 RepID=A0A1S1NRP3_9GAMM|nr:NO-inducible flavohemoprotein [Kushneria phosphatilytica]OHV07590.1 nitric oxide dioxygenase [Kushneria phosphatilytica]QEL10074.1 NO-inducible flavohemoprotein [Kushneria phosphatilytica]
MLTNEQARIIATTAPVVAEHAETIAKTFYPLMFERYPHVRSMFNMRHQQTGEQPRALARSVVAYALDREDPVALERLMTPIVNKHVAINLQPDQYPIVGECLMAAIGEVLGDAVTPDVADAWSGLYWEFANRLIDAEEQTYRQLEEAPGGWRGEREFYLIDRVPESDEIVSFYFKPVDGKPIRTFQPGQYLGVALEIDGEQSLRQYSLTSRPGDDFYRISVKREGQGRASRHLHDHVKVGDHVRLLAPVGEMVLDDRDAPVMLISGGVGQTPMLSLMAQALDAGRRVIYLHGARNARVHAFHEHLQAMSEQYGSQLTYRYVYSDPETADGQHHKGIIDRALLADYLPREATPSCYFTGPTGFMRDLDNELAALGVDAPYRHFEYFGPSGQLH